MDDLKNQSGTILSHVKLCASFRWHWCIQIRVTVRKHSTRVKDGNFLSPLTLKFDGWPWITIEHLLYATSRFVHHFIAIVEFKLAWLSGNAQFGSNWAIFVSCILEISRMTLKNKRAPLLSNIKFCASFHRHMWIQIGVTVRQRLNWVLTSVTLTFVVWPWPLTWISLLSMVITPEICMMIRWQGYCHKGVTDGQADIRTDRRTERLNHTWSCLVAAKDIVSHYMEINRWCRDDPVMDHPFAFP